MAKVELKVTESLATRYRPTHWDDVVGHKTAVTRFKGILADKDIPSAMLIYGPTGTGKTTLSRMFAYYLNCDSLNRCGKCASCRSGVAVHPDISEMNMSESRGIDDIRDLANKARFKPQHNLRVFILDEVHMLTTQAANAFLKPLEEPPAHTLWILATTNPEKLLPAIAGRCSLVALERLTVDDITDRLSVVCEQEEISYFAGDSGKELLTKIAEASGGHVRNSLNILESTVQYIKGLGKVKTKELQKLVGQAILNSADVAADLVAMKLLIALYLGNGKLVHATLADTQDYQALIYKLLNFNLYMLDSLFIEGKNQNVWHTGSNVEFRKKVVGAIAKSEKIQDFDDVAGKYVPIFVRVMDALANLKSEMANFLVAERPLLSARLGLLAREIKVMRKQ